ncbi:MAG: nucleotidyltransferase family protein [Roseimicrobium sp.]
MNAVETLEAHAAELRALGARRIGVFGSRARGEERPDSDVDVFVELEETKRTFGGFNDLYEFLEGLFNAKIDLVTDKALSERWAKRILPTVKYATLDR